MNANTNSLTQLVQGFSDWRRWAWLGFYDVRLTNRRSFFGLWWPTLSLGIFAFGVGSLFAYLLGRPISIFLPHVTLGWLAWNLISAGIINGSAIFISGRAVLQEAILPPNTLALRILTRLGIQSALNLFVVVAAFIYVSKPVPLMAIVAILGFALNVITLHGAMLFLGVVCARFRDIQHLVESAMRLAFFMTPILWIPTSDRSGRSVLVDYNPFYYMIETIRTPFLEGSFPTLPLLVVLGLAVASNAAGLIAFSLARRRIIYWL